jgi:glycosyltransferase involved in cell wall biosynthesis
MALSPNPTVSVLMLAYNHGRYIRGAVESVIAQRTSFPVEIVVGEDCSTDDTKAVLRDLAEANPGRVRLLLREHNIGANANFAHTLSACAGEFIALLEGDDHWVGTEKLQRQIEFLRANPSCSMCFHDAFFAEGDSLPGPRRFAQPKPHSRLTAAAILARNCVPTCSVVFRRSALPVLLPAILRLPMLDWPMWVLLSLVGYLAYLDEVWGCYRVHAGGSWSSQSNEKQLRNTVLFYDTILQVLPRALHPIAQHARKTALDGLVHILVASGRLREARVQAWRCLSSPPKRFRAPEGPRGLYWRLIMGFPSRKMVEQAPPPRSSL